MAKQKTAAKTVSRTKAKTTIEERSWGDYSLVVDTEQYAGNFERELAAYVIGAEDDYPTGEAEQALEVYARELPGDPFEPLRSWGLDDHGHDRPQAIYPTPGWSNTGRGGHYRVTAAKPFRHAAYLSVRMFLARRPTAEELRRLAARVRAFPAFRAAQEYGAPVKVTGMRLVRERTQVESEPVPLGGEW